MCAAALMRAGLAKLHHQAGYLGGFLAEVRGAPKARQLSEGHDVQIDAHDYSAARGLRGGLDL